MTRTVRDGEPADSAQKTNNGVQSRATHGTDAPWMFVSEISVVVGRFTQAVAAAFDAVARFALGTCDVAATTAFDADADALRTPSLSLLSCLISGDDPALSSSEATTTASSTSTLGFEGFAADESFLFGLGASSWG